MEGFWFGVMAWLGFVSTAVVVSLAIAGAWTIWEKVRVWKDDQSL